MGIKPTNETIPDAMNASLLQFYSNTAISNDF